MLILIYIDKLFLSCFLLMVYILNFRCGICCCILANGAECIWKITRMNLNARIDYVKYQDFLFNYLITRKDKINRSICESLRYEANTLSFGYTSSIAVSLNQIMQKIRYTSSSAISIKQITLKKFLHILHGC